MRNLYRILVILAVAAIFLLAFLFVTSNRDLVKLDMLFYHWQWNVSLGVLVIGMLAIGMLLGLLAGLGWRGLKGLFS
ncbi:MAG: lipopolysaccharide assembly protein LapA domain-containing protein [Alcanivorax sp.]|nr:lipopolysaccharide assembly protein LapA domain-containing protein [Alcanivorax sp.]